MELRITVKYHSDPRTGAGKLRAIGGGRQATIPYPHELHHTMKYWAAVEALVYKLERKSGQRLRLVHREFNDSTDIGKTSETFIFEVFDQAVPAFANREAVKYDRLPAGYATGL